MMTWSFLGGTIIEKKMVSSLVVLWELIKLSFLSTPPLAIDVFNPWFDVPIHDLPKQTLLFWSPISLSWRARDQAFRLFTTFAKHTEKVRLPLPLQHFSIYAICIVCVYKNIKIYFFVFVSFFASTQIPFFLFHCLTGRAWNGCCCNEITGQFAWGTCHCVWCLLLQS